MSARLVITKDGRTVVSVPLLQPGVEGNADVETAEPLLGELVEIFSIASNERRLRLMIQLMKSPETRFTELLQVGVNPKLVQDCVAPMVRSGLLVHEGKGAAYRPSAKGALVITMVTRVLAEALAAVESGKI